MSTCRNVLCLLIRTSNSDNTHQINVFIPRKLIPFTLFVSPVSWVFPNETTKKKNVFFFISCVSFHSERHRCHLFSTQITKKFEIFLNVQPATIRLHFFAFAFIFVSILNAHDYRLVHHSHIHSPYSFQTTYKLRT